MPVWVFIPLAIAAGYVFLCVFLYFSQGRFLYFPSRDIWQDPGAAGLEFEDVVLETADGEKLGAWYVPCDGAERVVLFCHGNAGNIAHRVESVRFFHALGLNCLVFDYRGYGDSSGKPSEEGTYLDGMAGWDWLIEDKGFEAGDVIVFGRSLGGAVAAKVASEVEAGGLAVESGFSSLGDIAAELYPFLPVRWFARYDYDTRRYVAQVDCPVLVVHSRDDEMIPFTHGQAIFDAAMEPKMFGEIKGGHNEGFVISVRENMEIWREWLGRLDGGNKWDK